MLKKLKIHFHQQDSIKHRGFHLILVFTKPLKDKRRKYFIWYSSSLHRIVMISRWRKECLYWILWTHLYSCFHYLTLSSFFLSSEGTHDSKFFNFFHFIIRTKWNFLPFFKLGDKRSEVPGFLPWQSISQRFHTNFFFLQGWGQCILVSKYVLNKDKNLIFHRKVLIFYSVLVSEWELGHFYSCREYFKFGKVGHDVDIKSSWLFHR